MLLLFLFHVTDSELFSFPQNGSEQNSESLLLFMFHGTEFRVVFLLCGMVRNGIPRVFCSAKQSEFRRNKPFVQSIPSSAEKLKICLAEIANPSWVYQTRRGREERTDRCVEGLYCKRPIQCPASSELLTPHPLTARRMSTPRLWCRGEDTLAGWRWGGGQ